MQSILFILNEAPYGSERVYNGLRLAAALCERAAIQIRIFLMADSVGCAKSGQTVPSGHYNVEQMLAKLLRHNVQIGLCGSCMDARGIRDEELMEGTRRSSMNQLGDWTVEAQKVLVS